MDAVVVPGQSFSVNAPFRQPIVIAHLSLMALAFLGCFPLALIHGARRHRRYHFYTLAVGFAIAILGFIAGWIAQVVSTTTNNNNNDETLTLIRVILGILGYTLLVLVLGQTALGLYQYRQSITTPLEHHQQQQKLLGFLDLDFSSSSSSWLGRIFPEDSLHLAIGWIVLIVAYAYLIVGAMVFTESCSASASSAGQCLMPLAIGSGFLGYGSLALLHLLNIFSLPRSSTPEYYEGLVLTLWGLICLIVSDTPILGSGWRAINLGLLWFAGGIFSVAISLQTWMPALRERNIVNALVICLTGRAIISGFTQNDPFASQIHSMLGHMMIIGAVARILQIMFRKSPADNLPRLIAQASNRDANNDMGDDDNIMDNDEEEDGDEEAGRANAYQATYRQLTGQSNASCKHKWIFASITIICGLLASFLAMAVGILFMGANIQWVNHVRYYMSDPATYVNVTIAVTFLWTTYVFIMCTIYRNIRPMSTSYYEYLGMSDMESVTTSSNESNSPHTPALGESQDMIAQRYEEQRQLHRARSLPARRGVEEPPAMRPSQYRAKRRSLLIQSPQQQHQQQQQQDPIAYAKKQRTRSSSGFSGVGGVLPDDINDNSDIRRSWISNASATSPGSATSFASSASSTPPLLSSSDIHHHHHHRRTVVFSDEPASMMAGENSNPSSGSAAVDAANVRKTESGRRKERVSSGKRRRKQQQQQQQKEPDDAGHLSSSSSSDSHSVAKYYSSERNSSDSQIK